jgi:hypothetical protein
VAHRLSSLCSVAVMLFGVRWQALRDTAFLRSASRDFPNQLALNAPEVHTAVEKAPSQLRSAGAVQNALVETQPPINLAAVSLHAMKS